MNNFVRVLRQYFERVGHHPSGTISIRHNGHSALVFPIKGGKKMKLKIFSPEGLVVKEKTARLWRISWELLRWREMIS